MIKFLIFALCVFSSPLYANAAEKLEQLKSISNAGAPFLTLKMLDQAQPDLDADLYNWILWEQERFSILEQWQQWNALLIRIESLPNDLPEPFQHQLITKQAHAYLQLAQTTTVRKIIRPYLWHPEAAQSLEYINWRKLIVESYIKDQRFDDARISMRRFSQDFGSIDSSWLESRAMILIQSNHLDEAADILKSNDSPNVKALALYVELLAKTKSAKSIWLEATQQAKKQQKGSLEYSRFWIVALFAAKHMSKVDLVIAYEAVLRTPYFSINSLLQISPDELWTAYDDYALLVGNRAELLQGNDEKWLSLAKNAMTLTPIKARSVLAHIMLNSRQPKSIESAAKTYLDTLDLEKPDAKKLINALFSQQGRFAEVQKIPVSIRFELVDLALKNSDIEKATRLMTGLDLRPDDTDLFAWQLRRARVLVLGGQTEEGHQVMNELLNSYQDISEQKTDRILQVLFDLQTIGADQQVIGNFKQLLTLAIAPRQKREILFWMADSFKALKQHHRAALLYLQSALYIGPEAMDPWAQTARYSAAESLQQAGLIDDARRIFEGLLKVSNKPSQRATLRNKIQQLWLNPLEQ